MFTHRPGGWQVVHVLLLKSWHLPTLLLLQPWIDRLCVVCSTVFDAIGSLAKRTVWVLQSICDLPTHVIQYIYNSGLWSWQVVILFLVTSFSWWPLRREVACDCWLCLYWLQRPMGPLARKKQRTTVINIRQNYRVTMSLNQSRTIIPGSINWKIVDTNRRQRASTTKQLTSLWAARLGEQKQRYSLSWPKRNCVRPSANITQYLHAHCETLQKAVSLHLERLLIYLTLQPVSFSRTN